MTVRSQGQPRTTRGYTATKRAIDLGICLITLPILLPVGLLCALAIRLESPGSVMFTQQRTGQHGVRFSMFKFRTMVQNAEELKASLQHLNILPPPDFKIPNDPRITRVGTFLRKTSLDELPQVINVLRGEMSIVGPRPTSFAASTYDLWHSERLEVLPGITGLWQVKGRGSMTFDERLRLDIEYMERRSTLYDLRLMAETALAVSGGRAPSPPSGPRHAGAAAGQCQPTCRAALTRLDRRRKAQRLPRPRHVRARVALVTGTGRSTLDDRLDAEVFRDQADGLVQ